MNSKRMHVLMIGCVVVLFGGLLAVIYFGDQILQTKSKKLVELKLDNKVIDEQQIALRQANKDIEKYAELDKIARQIVPQDKDQAKTVREIMKIAEQSGIKLSAINFPASNLGQATPKAAPSSDDSNKNSGNTPAKPTTPPVTQVKPADGVPGLYTMEITIQQDSNKPIPYSRLIDFLSRLENNRRTAQVTSVTIQPNTQDRSKLTFNLIVNVYIKP